MEPNATRINTASSSTDQASKRIVLNLILRAAASFAIPIRIFPDAG
jgi:hypothetical protein